MGFYRLDKPSEAAQRNSKSSSHRVGVGARCNVALPKGKPAPRLLPHYFGSSLVFYVKVCLVFVNIMVALYNKNVILTKNLIFLDYPKRLLIEFWF